MVDTCNFTLPHTYYDYNHIKKIFQDKLKFKVDSRYSNGSSLVAHYKNYSFSISKKQLRATGSLTKLYFGNNVENLYYNQFQDALNEFETLFEIPFNEATINRLDVSATFAMSQPVSMFLDILTTPYSYEIILYGNKTKGFVNKIQSLNFYDKVTELQKKDRVSYKTYLNDYLLRYELKFNKDLIKQLNLSDLKFKNLYNPDLYQTLLNKWFEGYQAVPKLTKMLPSQLSDKSLTAYKQSHIDSNLNTIGGLSIEKNRVYHSKMKKSVKHLISNYLDTLYPIEPLSTGLQLELDSKIENMYWKQMDQLREIMYPIEEVN